MSTFAPALSDREPAFTDQVAPLIHIQLCKCKCCCCQQSAFSWHKHLINMDRIGTGTGAGRRRRQRRVLARMQEAAFAMTSFKLQASSAQWPEVLSSSRLSEASQAGKQAGRLTDWQTSWAQDIRTDKRTVEQDNRLSLYWHKSSPEGSQVSFSKQI